MFREQRRYGNDPNVVVRTKTWGDPDKWQRKLAGTGNTEMVFTCSWSDWFIEEADEWRPEAWAIVKRCPSLIFQILTKRPDLIADRLPADWGGGYANVWLGVSVESQEYADSRIPKLCEIPAAIKFLSCEPLLGPIRLPEEFLRCPTCGYSRDDVGMQMDHHLCQGPGPRMGWVITGCESGDARRKMQDEWAEGITDQCRSTGIPIFNKQVEVNGRVEHDMSKFPPPLRFQELPHVGTVWA